MPLAMLCQIGCLIGLRYRRIRLAALTGRMAYARRLYRRTAAWLCALIYLVMTMQTIELYQSGMLTLQTGLPLHLCSMMGLCSPLVLFSRWELPRHAGYYLGVPGALGAILFPAVLQTMRADLTALLFYTLHSLLAVYPLLPQALGYRPTQGGARRAFGLGVCYLLVVGMINDILDTNYLFLRNPPANTPLAVMFSQGRLGYVCALMCLAMVILRLMAHQKK